MKKLQAKGKMRVSYFCMLSLMACILVGYSIPVSAAVVVTEDQDIADQFTRHTVTGITTDLPVLPDVTGFIGVSYLTIGDINKDGINEIVATSGVGPDSNTATSNGEVGLFTWNGINKDSWTKTILNNTFSFPNETIIKDIDNDGNLDIVVMDHFIGNSGPGGIFYLKNAGGTITNTANWTKKTIYEDTTTGGSANRSYHRAYFLDLDGDGYEDIITMKFSGWVGWLKNNGNGTYTPYQVGTGGGSLFAMFDVDQDGDLDIVATQFAITTGMFSCEVRGGPGGTDPLGDSLVWFENPGQQAIAANPGLVWNRHTIDNWYTSSNPIGKGMEVVVSDIDNDGVEELVVSSHNHQNDDSWYQTSVSRIWPSGIFYLEIPGLDGNTGNPKVTADWVPITIETGDPNFVYFDPDNNWDTPNGNKPYNDPAVIADVYAVDRRGDFYDQGSPGMVRAVDVNRDGRTDLVVPGDGKGRLYYYEAGTPVSGNLTFKRASLYTDLQCMPGDAQIVDIDNDGDLDIVAAIFDTSVAKPYPYTSGSVFVFENTIPPPTTTTTTVTPTTTTTTVTPTTTTTAVTSTTTTATPTLIDLSSFTANRGWGRIILRWVTESEMDNAGFNVYRAETEGGQYVKINDSLIAATGSPNQGAEYVFVDKGVEKGKTYYYKLEDVDLSGNSKFHGPVSAEPWFILSFTK